jgi:hypothetical protein
MVSRMRGEPPSWTMGFKGASEAIQRAVDVEVASALWEFVFPGKGREPVGLEAIFKLVAVIATR